MRARSVSQYFHIFVLICFEARVKGKRPHWVEYKQFYFGISATVCIISANFRTYAVHLAPIQYPFCLINQSYIGGEHLVTFYIMVLQSYFPYTILLLLRCLSK